jgi:16S rRNA (guanine527-N7)-methyltransferase
MTVPSLVDEARVRDWLMSLPGVDAVALERLELLVSMLREENSRQNLVSQSSLSLIWQRHIADSAQLLAHVPRETSGRWLDLGTGAGFPGLVIAALDPQREVQMVESRARRIDWLERARVALDLSNAKVLGQRLELIEAQPANVISARAFAQLDRLLELAERFSTKDTIWLLPKGQSAKQELEDLYGWQHTFHVEQSVTDPQAGIVVGTLAGRKGRTR